MPDARLITLLSDFGSRDAYVGIMKGIILGIAPQARLVDLCHEVPPQQIAVGALHLWSAVEYFPAGTIHLAVVDPGVGSARDPVVAVTERGCLVGPDNGLLYPAAQRLGLLEVRRLVEPRYFAPAVSQTFHGRDVFAPVAGHLAVGVAAAEMGPPLPELAPLRFPEPRKEGASIRGEVLHVDHFGNLITNIPASALDDFPASKVSVRIGEVSLSPLASAYADVPDGSPLAIIDSWGLLEVAVRGGSAARELRAARGTRVWVAVE